MNLESVLRDGFAQLGLPLDEQAIARYRLYAGALSEKNAVMNLTAIEGDENIARLHFLDCAALLTLADFSGKRVIDVGTGAGFPGLALKIACPDLSLTLVDSLDKRIGFLRETCELLGFTDVNCLHARAEELPEPYRAAYDIVTSRAVAKLNVLCELCLPLLKPGGVFIAMKGPAPQEELSEAARAIRLLGGEAERCAVYRLPHTDVTHSAVFIRKTANTPTKYPRRWAQIKKQPL